MKTSELTGASLDWAVAICETPNVANRLEKKRKPDLVANFKPSTDWAQGGPIIERERFARITLNVANQYTASIRNNIHYIDLDGDEAVRLVWIHGTGSTPLIAAMRCYVASKLGDTVEIPKELTE